MKKQSFYLSLFSFILNKPGNIIVLLLCILYGAVSCGDKEEDDGTEIYDIPDIYYTNYRFSTINPLEKNDTIELKVGDTIAIYMKSAIEWNVLAEDNSAINIADKGNVGYMVTTKQVDFVTAGILSDSFNFIFYIDIQSLNSEIQVFEPPTYQIDIENGNLRNTIQEELESSYAVRLLDKFELTYTTMNVGSVKYTNRADVDTITGTFKDNGNDLSIYIDNHLKYNFTFEKYEPASLIYSHYICQDLTEIFRIKYPTEQINKVLVTAECHKTDPK